MTFTLEIVGKNTDRIKNLIHSKHREEAEESANFLAAIVTANPEIERDYDTVASAFKAVTDIIDNNPDLLEKDIHFALISVTDEFYENRPILRVYLQRNGYLYLSKATEYKKDIEQISYDRLHPVDNLSLLYGCWSINA